MVSLLLTLIVCRSVVLYGLLFGQWVLGGPLMERSTLSRVSITNKCQLMSYFSFRRPFMCRVRNQYTFHTGANNKCNVPRPAPIVHGSPALTGTVMNTNCSSTPSSNTGCTFLDTSNSSFGRGFATVGGGVFALLRNSNGFKIWHFERQSIPHDVSCGNPDPDSWPTPVAFLSADNCNVESFSPQRLILDITLCGGWANGDYPNSGCPATCTQQVTTGNNFVGAYFLNILLIVPYQYESRCQVAYQLHNCI
jgi:hypothetical protein